MHTPACSQLLLLLLLLLQVESHRFFPAPFKASVRALLLSYQRLHRQRQLQQAAALRLRACRASSSSSGAASRAHLGDIPFELVSVWHAENAAGQPLQTTTNVQG